MGGTGFASAVHVQMSRELILACQVLQTAKQSPSVSIPLSPFPCHSSAFLG